MCKVFDKMVGSNGPTKHCTVLLWSKIQMVPSETLAGHLGLGPGLLSLNTVKKRIQNCK